MKKYFLSIALLGMLFSCSTTNEEIGFGGNLTAEEQVAELNGSEWKLKSCPNQEWIILNTYSLCNYFKEVKFAGNSIFIQHNNSNPPTQHFVCSYESNDIPLSIQACSNPTWKPYFWWDIVYYTNNELVIDLVEIDRIGTMTDARFTFEKM
jgi:hypothetical protein